MPSWAAGPVIPPYGEVSLPIQLHKVPGAPVYYLVGLSGVDENTRIVPPEQTFSRRLRFEVGGIRFLVRHLGPAHVPGDAVMLVEDLDALFSGDMIYRGRVPFLDSPEADAKQRLEGLDFLTSLDPLQRFIMPGHGDASGDPAQAVAATRDYIQFVRDAMRRAVDDFLSFDEADRRADWSRYRDLLALDASNRGNAFRVFLEMEAASFRVRRPGLKGGTMDEERRPGPADLPISWSGQRS
jgi:glyoxylase-like metal-dependent hydrolase (beta-lactamase superfamily II)